jgi:hypothetical protein
MSKRMKKIVTTYGSFATGAELADAVTRYGVALARTHTVDVVDLPIVTADGTAGRVQLRVGWLCDMATVSEDGAWGDLREDDTLLALIERTALVDGRRRRPPRMKSVTDWSVAGPNWEEII